MARKFIDNNGLLYLWSKIVAKFVQKEAGKGLSDNNYTSAEKTKLSNVAENANNYTLPTASSSTLGGVKVGAGLEISGQGVISATGGGVADAVAWSNVQDKPESFTPSTHTHSEGDIAGLSSTLTGFVTNARVGQANGVASLNAEGVIPSSQLPSYVDDVVEGYYNATDGNFYVDSGYSQLITGSSGIIYLDVSTNISYRFGGTTYTPITSSDMVVITNEEIDAIVAM